MRHGKNYSLVKTSKGEDEDQNSGAIGFYPVPSRYICACSQLSKVFHILEQGFDHYRFISASI